MSLINQVLRDLDKRHAVAAAAPAAVKAAHALVPANPLRRTARWGIGIAITAAAVVGGGVAQGSIDWPGRTAAAAPVAVVMPLAPALTPVVTVAAVEPTPAVAAAPAPVAAEPRATVQSAEVQVIPSTREVETRLAAAPSAEPVVHALAAPTSRSAHPLPHGEPAPRSHHRAAEPTSAAAPLSPRPEPRIDKRMAERTPQERAEAHYQRGVTAHQAGQINDSADAFMAALREDARFAPPRQAQAGLLIGQSRRDEALALLQEGIALSPQEPTLALMLARLQAENHDLAAAADTLKAASINATGNAEYQGLHAAILQRANRHAESVERYSAALRLAPAHSVWWMGLGISLAANGQMDAAREAFTRAKSTGALPAEAGQYVELRLRQML